MAALLKKSTTYVAYGLIAVVVIYAFAYFLPSNPSPFLQNKPLHDPFWRTAFWTHVGLGALALALGPFLLSTRRRQHYLNQHKALGKVYVISILLASIGAFYAALFADTGWIAGLGFATLASAWFYTTLPVHTTKANQSAPGLDAS